MENLSHSDNGDTDINVSQMLDRYKISDADLKNVESFGKIIAPKMTEVIDEWYNWLRTQPEFEEFFSEPETLERVQKLQVDYAKEFYRGKVDEAYIIRRYALGEVHARIDLPLNAYFKGINALRTTYIGMLKESNIPKATHFAISEAITKLVFLDTAIIVESYTTTINAQISAQSKSLMELSTPVTQIWNGILLLPVVGIIDSKRGQDIMNATLAKIAETQARMFILDISGVAIVDTAVANHLIKITKATLLMGCESTISGVSPAIAQTIVELGIDIGTVKTTATMRDALANAFQRTGVELREIS